MSDPQPTASGVSKARKIVSKILLVTLLVVLGIETRAAVGYAWSGVALQGNSQEGIFADKTHAEVKSLLKFWPSESIVREQEGEVEYRYSWYSVLRPMMSDTQPAYYVIKKKIGEAEGVVYDVASPGEGEINRLRNMLSSDENYEEDYESDEGFGGGGFGGPGEGGFGGPPPESPILTALDADSDGELSAEEVEGAVAALLKADKDGDGKLTGAEAHPETPFRGRGNGGGGGAGERRRPPLEDDDETPETDEDPADGEVTSDSE